MVGFFGCHGLEKEDPEFEQNLKVLEVIVGVLGNAWQRESVLDTLEQRIASRTRELTAFSDMAVLAGEAQDLPDILLPALSRIMEISNCEAACLHLLSKEDNTFKLVAQRGLPAEFQERMQLIQIDKSFLAKMDQTEQDGFTSGGDLTALMPDALHLPGFGASFGAGLRVRGQTLGLLSCYRISNEPFLLFHASLLIAIGEQLGIIVENYRLRLEAEELATIEERQRLARELHDAVSQSLYSLTLFAHSGRDALEEGDQDKLEDSLLQLEENALLALKEMRLLLYQLRSPALERGLAQAIDSRLELVEHRLGIKTTWRIDDTIGLSKRVEQELFRIITEALNNSLKHARASEVAVGLKSDGEQIVLTISDNGSGFNPVQVYEGMGLRNMRERAAELAGQLKVSSEPGGGTQVHLTIDQKALPDVEV